MGSYGPFGRMPAYSQFSPSPLVGQQFGAVGVGKLHYLFLQQAKATCTIEGSHGQTEGCM